MIPARFVVAAAIAVVLAASPTGAQNDPRPDAERLKQNDAWCPIVLNHHLPAITNAFAEYVKTELQKKRSKRRDQEVYDAVAPLLETLVSVGRMDERDPVRQAHLAMACTLGLPVVRKMIAGEFR